MKRADIARAFVHLFNRHYKADELAAMLGLEDIYSSFAFRDMVKIITALLKTHRAESLVELVTGDQYFAYIEEDNIWKRFCSLYQVR